MDGSVTHEMTTYTYTYTDFKHWFCICSIWHSVSTDMLYLQQDQLSQMSPTSGYGRDLDQTCWCEAIQNISGN